MPAELEPGGVALVCARRDEPGPNDTATRSGYAGPMNLADYADNLQVSAYMGKIVAICLVVIVIVLVVRAIRGKRK